MDGFDALIDEYRPRIGWRRSQRGNLTRGSPGGWRLTVFEQPAGSGRYSWSMSNGLSVRYSRRGYPSEEAAVEAVWEEADREPPVSAHLTADRAPRGP